MNFKLPRALAVLVVLAVLPPGAVVAEPADLEKYYPMPPHTVRWYAIRELPSGMPVDIVSFAIVGREVLPGGNVVSLVEHRWTGGISIDYQQVLPGQVQLDRLVVMRNATLTDVRFAPALPILRAPVEVGRSWSETPQGDQPYTFRVESRFATRVLGVDVQDCVRVVRTRGSTEDHKTEYCAGIGVAAFEMLTRGTTWLRAELVSLAAEADLIAVKAGDRGCEYIFDPLVPASGKLAVTVVALGERPSSFEHPASENIHIGLGPGAKRGGWRMEIKGPQRSALQTFFWSGACQADFVAPPPALGPSVALVRQDSERGCVVFTVMGVGWQANEPLTLTLAGPGWNTETSSIGAANAYGVSRPAFVPFAGNLPGGEYTLTMKGTSLATTLGVECRRAGFCAVKFWRKR